MADLTPTLVPFDERFLDASFSWLQDAELRRLIRATPVTRPQQRAWFASLAGRKDYLIRGVELNGRAIGACGLKHVTANDGEYWGYIGAPEARGKGVGRWIVERCMTWARELDLTSVWLQVGIDNPVAAGVYRKVGFIETERTETEIIMRRALS